MLPLSDYSSYICILPPHSKCNNYYGILVRVYYQIQKYEMIIIYFTSKNMCPPGTSI